MTLLYRQPRPQLTNYNVGVEGMSRDPDLHLNWRASEASETLSGVYKFELVRYVYIYIYICMEVRMS